MEAFEIYEKKLSRTNLKGWFIKPFPYPDVIVILEEKWEKCRRKVAYE